MIATTRRRRLAIERLERATLWLVYAQPRFVANRVLDFVAAS